MIAAGIAGVWCLFWNNRFYTRAIRDLGRLKEPKSKWTRSVLETCQRKAHHTPAIPAAIIAYKNTFCFTQNSSILIPPDDF